MRRRSTHGLVTLILLFAIGSRAICDSKPPAFEIKQPTIVAFFPPVSDTDLRDGDTNESLSDFQFYAMQVREPLRKIGIDFEVVYVHSFEVDFRNKKSLFHPGKSEVGYYFIAPAEKPRVEYGVMTDGDILDVAHKYFGIPKN